MIDQTETVPRTGWLLAVAVAREPARHGQCRVGLKTWNGLIAEDDQTMPEIRCRVCGVLVTHPTAVYEDNSVWGECDYCRTVRSREKPSEGLTEAHREALHDVPEDFVSLARRINRDIQAVAAGEGRSVARRGE